MEPKEPRNRSCWNSSFIAFATRKSPRGTDLVKTESLKEELEDLAGTQRLVGDKSGGATGDSHRVSCLLDTLKAIRERLHIVLDAIFVEGVSQRILGFLEVIEDVGWPKVRVISF